MPEDGQTENAKETIFRFFQEIHQNSAQALATAKASYVVAQRTEMMVNEIGRRLFGDGARPRAATQVADVLRTVGMTAKQWKNIQRGLRDILG